MVTTCQFIDVLAQARGLQVHISVKMSACFGRRKCSLSLSKYCENYPTKMSLGKALFHCSSDKLNSYIDL